MSKFISENRLNKKMIENVLSLSVDAKRAKKENSNVINTTSGTYYDDNGRLHVFDCVNEHFIHCDYNHDLSYSGIVGPIEICEVLFPWVLGEDYLDTFGDYYFDAISTMGGTGAIAMTFCNYSDYGETILLPSIKWPAYVQIANNYNLVAKDYKLFTDDLKFNVSSLKEEILKLIGKQDKVIVVVNDPCHNPTGYSMSGTDYDLLIETLNDVSKDIKVTLLLDVAYLDYSYEYGNVTRNYFKKLVNLSDNVQVLFAFSASKTFGIYGLRLGGLLHMTKDKEESTDFIDTAKFFARSTWSNPNHFAVNTVVDTLKDKVLKEHFVEELHIVSENLIKRGNELVSHLDLYGVPHAAYRGGFFVQVFENDKEFLQEIRDNLVYAIEMNGGLRLAVSSISYSEASRLGEIIGKCYKHLQERRGN